MRVKLCNFLLQGTAYSNWDSKNYFNKWMEKKIHNDHWKQTYHFQLRKWTAAGAYQGRISITMSVLLILRQLLGVPWWQRATRMSWTLVWSGVPPFGYSLASLRSSKTSWEVLPKNYGILFYRSFCFVWGFEGDVGCLFGFCFYMIGVYSLLVLG